MAALTASGNQGTITIEGLSASAGVNLRTDIGAHRHWRLFIYAGVQVDNVALYGLYLYATDNLGSRATDNGETDLYNASATSFQSAHRAFDDSATTFWANRELYDDQGTAGSWLSVEFVDPKDIYKVGLQDQPNSNGDFATAITDFGLQYSDDGNVWYERHRQQLTWTSDVASASNDYTQNYTLYDINVAAVTLPSLTVENAAGIFTLPLPTLISTAASGSSASGIASKLKLQSLTASGYSGPSSAALPFMSAAATAISGSASGLDTTVLPRLTLASTTTEPNTSGAAIRLPRLTLSGRTDTEGDITGVVLPRLSVASTMVTGTAGNATLFLPKLKLSATSTSNPGVILPLPTLASIAIAGSDAQGKITLPTLTVSAISAPPLTLPLLSVTGQASSASAANGRIRLPRITVSGYSAKTGVTLPSLLISSTVRTGSATSAALRLPRLSVQSVSDQSGVVIPAPTLASAAVSGGLARGNLYLPSLSASGAAESPESATGSIILPVLSVSAAVIQDNIWSGAGTLKRLSLAATAVTGSVSTGVIVLPAPEYGTLTLSTDQAYQLAIELPVLHLAAQSLEPATAVAGNAITMNLRHKGVTLFDSYGYNSHTTFNGVQLAASASGIFVLTGDTDNGVAIAASLTLGKLDFDSEQIKMIDEVYVGYQASGALTLMASADDGTQYAYELAPRTAGIRHTSRTKLGKGLRGRYFQIGLANIDGESFSVDAFSPMPTELRRRVR